MIATGMAFAGTRPRRAFSESRSRAGVTMLEVLVSLGVVSLLVGLLLPAVQSARESARRAECINRLKQIGAASEAFFAQHNAYPTGAYPYLSTAARGGGDVNMAPHVQLLPFLDQTELANRFDHQEDGRGTRQDPPVSQVNGVLLSTRLPIFECPSDSVSVPRNNYRICSGTSTGLHETLPPHGPNASLRGMRSGDGLRADPRFRDGKSQTAAYAEKLAGDRDPDTYTPWRDLVYVLPYPRPFKRPDDAREGCTQPLPSDPDHASYGGSTWVLAGFTQSWYNHVLPPNSEIPDCATGLEALGAYAARALHPGGANMLFADGSVKFINESIDLTVWRAIGTIDGGEVVDSF